MRDAVQNLLLRTKESGKTEACTGLKTCSSVFFEEWLRFLEERGRLWPHAASVTPHRPRAQLRPLFRVPVVHPPPSPGAAPGCPVRATTVCALIQANPPAHHRPNPPHPQSLPVVPPACHSTVTRAVPPSPTLLVLCSSRSRHLWWLQFACELWKGCSFIRVSLVPQIVPGAQEILVK